MYGTTLQCPIVFADVTGAWLGRSCCISRLVICTGPGRPALTMSHTDHCASGVHESHRLAADIAGCSKRLNAHQQKHQQRQYGFTHHLTPKYTLSHLMHKRRIRLGRARLHWETVFHGSSIAVPVLQVDATLRRLNKCRVSVAIHMQLTM